VDKGDPDKNKKDKKKHKKKKDKKRHKKKKQRKRNRRVGASLRPR
jgi:hypothetical protein